MYHPRKNRRYFRSISSLPTTSSDNTGSVHNWSPITVCVLFTEDTEAFDVNHTDGVKVFQTVGAAMRKEWKLFFYIRPILQELIYPIKGWAKSETSPSKVLIKKYMPRFLVFRNIISTIIIIISASSLLILFTVYFWPLMYRYRRISIYCREFR